ncbi:SGNH/GDSL hydrolase family protein [Acidiferrimicrobium sp. IK]|uniref:SGNH/GDSL hydrolase family protein n=1 Tax=Acidiferrimicrobium sp. IK TaxID=2871700 RepID=UPI0021CB1238|nr:SGNH/GDSL hydrolase family protein [Acidiferrimicrobium sp. IK]MCU4184038.1 SGNH/GDSL hydrolase family protein [Acidiferrimicrobium sp. IK]
MATYTVLEAVTWSGVWNDLAITLEFSAGAITPNEQQQYALDYFLVPNGQAQNPYGETGPWARSPAPPAVAPSGSTPVADGAGGLTWQDLNGAYGPAGSPSALAALATPGQTQPNLGALRPAQAALADRASAPANILAIGDSITEGVGASVVGNRWLNRLMTSLQSGLPSGAVGGFGYIPAYYNDVAEGAVEVWTFSGTTTPTQQGDYGLGMRAMLIDTTDTGTATITCSSIGLVFTPAMGAACTVSVVVDGGAPQTSTIAAGTISQVFTPTVDGDGPHTFTVGLTAGNAVFEGCYVYNGDESKGVRVFDGAKSGMQTSDFLAQVSTAGPAWINTAADVVLIALGTNDWRSGMTAATFQANLDSLISDVAAQINKPATYILVAFPQPGAPGQNGQTATWAQFLAAYYAAAAARTDTVVCDLGQRMYSYYVEGSDPLGLWWPTDGLYVHPSDKGHALVGAILSSFIAGELLGAREGMPVGGDAAWIAPTLVNAWANLGNGFGPVGYRKDSNGFVHLRGAVNSGTAGAIFTLPVGYRPGSSLICPVVSNDLFGEVRIVSGVVTAQVYSSTYVSLDGISFLAEA